MSDDDTRVRADERRRLMAELELERNQLVRNVETCRLRDITAPFIGAWTVLDIMDHIADADRQVAEALRAFRSGGASSSPAFGCDATPEVRSQDASMIWPGLERLRGGREALLAEVAAFSDEELTSDGSVPLALVTACKEHDKLHWHDIAAKLAGMAGARRNGGMTEQSTTES